MTAERWTADMVRALPDDRYRYEVIDGELFVTPAPSAQHQRAVRELFVRLAAYLRDDLSRGERFARRHLVSRRHAVAARSLHRAGTIRSATRADMVRDPRPPACRRSAFSFDGPCRPTGQTPAVSTRGRGRVLDHRSRRASRGAVAAGG